MRIASLKSVGRQIFVLSVPLGSLLLGDKMAQAFGKAFDSQQALSLKLLPNGLTANSILHKVAIFLLCRQLALAEVT